MRPSGPVQHPIYERHSSALYGVPILLVLLVVVATILRFILITAQSLWLDEGFTLAYARTASLRQVLRLSTCNTTDCASPLYPLLLHGVIRWLGDSVLVLRGFSAVCGAMSVMTLIWAGRKLYDLPGAVLAGSLASISAFAVWYSQEARSYTLSILLMTGAIGGLAECRKSVASDPLIFARAILALCVGFGVLSNVLFALGAAGLCCGDLIVARDRQRCWARWWPAVVASIPSLLLFGAIQLRRGRPIRTITSLDQNGLLNAVYTLYGQLVGTTFGPPQATLRGANKLAALEDYWFPLLLAGALAGALMAVVFRALRRRFESRPERVENIWLFVWSVLVGATLSEALGLLTGINWQPRHSFFLFPQILLIIAGSAQMGWSERIHSVRAAVALAVGLFSVTNLWGIYNYFEDSRYGKDDYRGAAAYLSRAAQRGQPTALLFGTSVLLRYYGDSSTVDLTSLEDGIADDSLEALSRPGGEVVVAINREFYWRGGLGVHRVLDTLFAVRDHYQLQYFDFYRLVPRH